MPDAWDADRTPVVVGVGRVTWRPKDRKEKRTLLSLVVEGARLAAADAASSAPCDAAALLSGVGCLACPGTVFDLTTRSRYYPNLPASVARDVGAAHLLRPEERGVGLRYAGASANSSQLFLNDMAERISRGELRSGLVCGGEVQHRHAVLKKDDPGVGPPGLLEGSQPYDDITPQERRHGLDMPIATYSVCETALAASLGRSQEEHRRGVARMMSGMSSVAAAPQNAGHAWFPTAYSAAEAGDATKQNRMVNYPYTKRMNAFLGVNMAAAVLVMSQGEARRNGIPEERWVRLHGCGDARDPHPLLARPRLHASRSFELAADAALRQAGLASARECAHLDLYACFPVVPGIAARALGVADPEDGAALTQIGGLMYHGGPGANGGTHAIAAMVESLRRDASPRSYGLVYAQGGASPTKHSIGIYSRAPLPGAWAREPPSAAAAALAREEGRVVAEAPEGAGVVEAFTVAHDGAAPERCTVIGTLAAGAAAGQRFVAVSADAALAARCVAEPMIGRTVTIATVEKPSGPLSVFTIPAAAKM